MINSGSCFDLKRVRVLCLEITAEMYDTAEAARLHQDVIDQMVQLRDDLALAAGLDFAHGGLRQGALDAVDRMIRAALG